MIETVLRRLVLEGRAFVYLCGLADRRGAVALTVALSAIPLIGFIGMAVDLSIVVETRAALDMAADAASLSAAKTAANAVSAGSANAIALGQSAGQQWFVAQTSLAGNAKTSNPSVVVSKSGTVITATVTYQAQVKLFFGPMFGVDTAAVSNTSVSTMTSNTYLTITFLLDNSSSMLLASTEAAIQQLQTLTLNQPASVQNNVPGGLGNPATVPHGCAFACHWQTGSYPPDYYQLAKNAGIQLRADVLQLAVKNALQTMQADAVVANQFGVGIFTFDNSLHQIYPSGSTTTTTDIIDANAALTNIAIPCCADVADTNFPVAMASLASIETTAGDGSSPLTPKKVLIVVTDGMADYGSRVIADGATGAGPSNGGLEGPLNPADCDAIKALGYTIYVLYTPYNSDDTVLLFDNIAAQKYLTGSPSTMDINLSGCASYPANFANASDPQAIVTALNQMLLSAIGDAGRFSQ